VGEISYGERLDFDLAARSEIFSLGNEEAMKEEILKAKQGHDSVGASVVTVIRGAPAGLGEGLYYKFDAAIAAAMMGINGVKAVEIGEGVCASKMRGSENNDSMGASYAGVNLGVDNSTLDGAGDRSNLNGGKFDEYKSEADGATCRGSNSDEKFGFASNHAGGTLGGMTSRQEVVIKTHFKPTPSIFLPQPTQNVRGEDVICELRGRHDPCIGVRGSVVATAMARLVTADMLLLNLSANLANLKKIYG